MASDDQQEVYMTSNIDNDMFDYSFLFADDDYDQSSLPPPIMNNSDIDQQVYTSSNNIGNDEQCFDLSFLAKIFADDKYDDQSTLPPPIINNNYDDQQVYTTSNNIVGNDDDCFDFSSLEKIFADDNHDDQSTLPPPINNNYMMTSHHQEDPILEETNYSMPCLNVVYPDPPAEEIVDNNLNKRKRVQEEDEEVVSPLRRCIFKAAPETLENQHNHLFHQETALMHGSITPSSSPRSSYAAIQPYTVNNNVSHVDVSDYYSVGSLVPPTIMGGDPLMKKAILTGSRRKTPIAWTVEEHVRFLIGIVDGYRGDWKTISTVFVRTRTTAQVTSHAQKYYLHQQKIANPSFKRRRRSRSIYDIVSLSLTWTFLRSPTHSDMCVLR